MGSELSHWPEVPQLVVTETRLLSLETHPTMKPSGGTMGESVFKGKKVVLGYFLFLQHESLRLDIVRNRLTRKQILSRC